MFEIPRGTRDFTPDVMYKRRYIENLFRTVFKTYGYQEIQTPTFEHIELFLEKSGESVLDEIYDFHDKGNRRLALRPELTAPVMRMYVDKLQMEPKPLKLFYFGNCFRYDRPQKGRYREFLQAGCELIGSNKPEAIAELIALSMDMLDHIGLKDIELQVGNLTLLSAVFEHLDLTDDQRKLLLPHIDKEEFEEVEDLLIQWQLDEKKIQVFLKILMEKDSKELFDLIEGNEELSSEIRRVQEIMNLLHEQFSIDMAELNIGIVRGLDYYSGIVFEVKAPVLGAEKQICGGGEYNLISLFGGRDTPTAGFALGFDRTILALEEEKASFPKSKVHCYFVCYNEDMIPIALSLATSLRRNNQIICDIDLVRRGIGKALKHASSKNALYAVIVGPRELEAGKITLRDMKSGDQEEVDIKAFSQNPKQFLKKL